MKITTNQLRRIIRESLDYSREMDIEFFASQIGEEIEENAYYEPVIYADKMKWTKEEILLQMEKLNIGPFEITETENYWMVQ